MNFELTKDIKTIQREAYSVLKVMIIEQLGPPLSEIIKEL